MSPGFTPHSFASSRLEAPISMNMSLISTGFLRASGDKICGGLEPITPVISPLDVTIVTRCASITCDHQPPTVWKRMKPLSSMFVTINPTSSKWPATMILGPPSLPVFLAIRLPSPSVVTSSAYAAMYFFITSRGSRSFPGIPFASVKSLSMVNVSSNLAIISTPLIFIQPYYTEHAI